MKTAILATANQLVDAANSRPVFTSIFGSASGWAAFDFLRYSQIGAAILAMLVSLCALILTAPKAWRELRSWFSR